MTVRVSGHVAWGSLRLAGDRAADVADNCAGPRAPEMGTWLALPSSLPAAEQGRLDLQETCPEARRPPSAACIRNGDSDVSRDVSHSWRSAVRSPGVLRSAVLATGHSPDSGQAGCEPVSGGACHRPPRPPIASARSSPRGLMFPLRSPSPSAPIPIHLLDFISSRL